MAQQLQALDQELSAQRIHESVACKVIFDGKDPLTFITRFGVVQVACQQAHCQSHGKDFTPLNRVLPEHSGCITTRSVHELSCLFAALSPSYEMGNQLLAIALQEPKLLSASKSERIVQSHGAAIRRQEKQEAEQVLSATTEEEVTPLPLQDLGNASTIGLGRRTDGAGATEVGRRRLGSTSDRVVEGQLETHRGAKSRGVDAERPWKP